MTVAYRRKRESKTNYNKRLKLLISHKTRVVIRKSLKNIMVQFVNFDPKGDVIVANANSIQLLKLGWKYSRNNLPAAYLTGLLAGKTAVEKGVKEAIVDLGMNESVKGCKLYSSIKGIIDSGVKINCSKEILPSDERIVGKHIAAYANLLKEKGEIDKKFSSMVKNNIDASKIEESFNDIKKKILG